MAKGKWIDDLAAETPLQQAARHVLALRLEVVHTELVRTRDAPDEDPEYVHQLRVATRRATAALDIFADCLPNKVYRRARKQLRRIRRAAGDARDWDVFLEDLATHPRTPETRPGLDALIGYATARRDVAHGRLQEAFTADPGAFARLAAATVASVRNPRSGPGYLIDLALPRLVVLLGELNQAASDDLNDYENLHQVRIIGKRLRYAMEVFAGCFAPPFREKLYPAIEEMQTILGHANDSYVANQRLAAVRESLRKAAPAEWDRYRPGIEGLLHHHERRLLEQRQHFLNWWGLWQPYGNEFALRIRLEELRLDPGRDDPATQASGQRPHLMMHEDRA
ncbi:MAG: CHAD domain-containing protein [Planctomycetaceae bacterium]|nr:CHAD domain-containing protein [Planctomycetaceae bacterium]